MKKILSFFILGVTFFIFLPNVASYALEPVIAVVSIKSVNPYNQAFSGFEQELKDSGVKKFLYQFDLGSFEDNQGELVNKINILKPNLIFAIGTKATLFAQENFKEVPIISSMVLSPVKSGVSGNPEGLGDSTVEVSLDIPLEVQFKKLKEVLPSVKRVGVLYNAKDYEWIKRVAMVGRKYGLAIVAKPVNAGTDVPRLLDEIVKEVDCLWAQADNLIYNVQSSEYIILTLIRNKLPFMAFSSSYVKAGALFALECDYVNIGRQSAILAIRILKGADPKLIASVEPKKVMLVVNQRIAQLIGINIPLEIMNQAKEVYQ